jgi:type IV pilus assembly protein PilX
VILMKKIINTQQGFVLIISLILLTAMTILVISAMNGVSINERMAGSYMDRNRAYQSAEMALRQGAAILQANADLCVEGCINTNNISGVTAASTTLPTTWVDDDAANISPPAGQAVSGKFKISLLPDSFLPASKDPSACSAYSILGKGIGIDSATSVILQTVAFVCSI